MEVTLAWGTREIRLDLPDDRPVSVKEGLLSVQDREILEAWTEPGGEIRPSLAVFVNNSHIRYLDGWQTILQAGDRIYVIPVLAGG